MTNMVPGSLNRMDFTRGGKMGLMVNGSEVHKRFWSTQVFFSMGRAMLT